MTEHTEKFTGGEVVMFEHCTLRPDPAAVEPDSMHRASGWKPLTGYVEVDPRYDRVAWIRALGTDDIIQAISNNPRDPAPGLVRNLRVVSRLGVEG